MSWLPITGTLTGLDTVNSYQVYWDSGTDGAEWALLFEDQAPFSFIYLKNIGILRGAFYKFYFNGVNQHGVGAPS